MPGQEFPQMIFHIVEEPLTINTKEEKAYYLDRGWMLTPQHFDALKAVKAKIAYHESEVRRLKEILVGMDVPEEEKNEKFICSVCGYEAKSNGGLGAHLAAHKRKQNEAEEVRT